MYCSPSIFRNVRCWVVPWLVAGFFLLQLPVPVEAEQASSSSPDASVAPLMVRVGETGTASVYVWKAEPTGKVSEVVFTDAAGRALSVREYMGTSPRLEIDLAAGRLEVFGQPDGTVQVQGLLLADTTPKAFSFKISDAMNEKDFDALRQSAGFDTLMRLVRSDGNRQLGENLVAFLLSQGWAQRSPDGGLDIVPNEMDRWGCFIACLALGGAILLVGPACGAGPASCFAAIAAVVAAYHNVEQAC